MREINSIEEFNSVVQQGTPVLLDFYADWCGPCKSLAPILNEVSNELKEDAIVAKINIDNNRRLASRFKVRSIPALFFLKDGQIKDQLLGLQSKTVLTEKLNELKNIA